MSQSLTSTAPRAPQQTTQAPLSILRTETVLSRFPIHTLAKRGRIAIAIRRTNAQGALDLRWDVSYNERYGPPRQLAYKLDTIVINQILDALPRPLPRVIPVGSLTHACGMLDLHDSGRQQAELKSAFHQNASAYIVAYLRYRGRDGMERIINTGFTRYSVVFTGEHLPEGTIADAVYLVLNDIYRDILNHAPVRPLNYGYLKALTPMAQRFYELLSYKMFAALKHRHPQATLRYADYCLLSTQQRYTAFEQVKKQMFKVHRPHVESGYLTKVQYQATTDEDGLPDWLLHYTPGPKARAEYAVFMRQPGADTATALTLPTDVDQDDLLATVTREPSGAPPCPPRETSLPPRVALAAREQQVRSAPLPAPTPRTTRAASLEASALPDTSPVDPLQAQAAALVGQFYQRFHGLAQVTPSPKELAQATDLLTAHGAAKAHYLVDFSYQTARATQYQPQVFGGILHYLDRALVAYDAQTVRSTPAATQREQYLAWEHQQLAHLRAALPSAALAALEAAARARLVAEGTPAVALSLAVRVAVDQALAAQAGLPAFEAWRQTPEAGA